MMLDKLRLIAHKRDVPYQSLIKVFLYERINQELVHLERGEDGLPSEKVGVGKVGTSGGGSLRWVWERRCLQE